MKFDVCIIGGGTGGVAAAVAAAELNSTVVLVEEDSWLGGQFTSQGVPADEHKWIEQHPGTRSYGQLRERIRDVYRRSYPLTAESRRAVSLSPGAGYVSRLCVEPRIAEHAFEETLFPFIAQGLVRVLRQHEVVNIAVVGDRIQSVSIQSVLNGDYFDIEAEIFIDATEFGDVLELAGVESVVGAESRKDTGELHALPGDADPMDQQSATWCFAVDVRPGEDHTIDRPEEYGFWSSYSAPFWPGPHLSWTGLEGVWGKPQYRQLFTDAGETDVADDHWHHRRILAPGSFEPGFLSSGVTLANWSPLDYWLKPFVGVSAEDRALAIEGARQQSLSFLYWIQTEAPRHDGGVGYSELRLRSDVFETEGLARHVYVRESRRLKAEFTVLEQHVGIEARPDATSAEWFPDSVGIGAYRIDLHPSTSLRPYVDVDSYPFQIPFGSLIPQRVTNLLAASKNIGTTHVTNGAYRLHAVEWSIGYAAGAAAAVSAREKTFPTAIRADAGKLEDFQGLLTTMGVELAWPNFGPLAAQDSFGFPTALNTPARGIKSD